MRTKITINREIKREPVSMSTKFIKPFDELGGIEVDILGIPFGGNIKGKDADGDFFDERTDIGLNIGDTRPIVFLHGFTPDGDEEQNPLEWIGQAKYTHADSRGHWFLGRLSSQSALAQRITPELLNRDMIKASSGAMHHLIRAGLDGHVTVWPVGEISIFDTNNVRQPANDLAVVSLHSGAIKSHDMAIEPSKATANIDVKTLIPYIIKEIIQS